MDDQNRVIKLLQGLPSFAISKFNYDAESVAYLSNYHIANIVTSALLALPSITSDSTVTDAMAGVGGNTMVFANHFKRVIAVEMNIERACMLRKNLQSVRLDDRVTVINSDYLVAQKTLTQDIVFFDPPWGDDYKQHTAKCIKIGDISLEDLAIATNCKYCLFKLPYNYDAQIFSQLYSTYAFVTMFHFTRPNSCMYILLKRL